MLGIGLAVKVRYQQYVLFAFTLPDLSRDIIASNYVTIAFDNSTCYYICRIREGGTTHVSADSCWKPVFDTHSSDRVLPRLNLRARLWGIDGCEHHGRGVYSWHIYNSWGQASRSR